jgi:uncharacterized protein (DUF1778 family)
MSRKGKPFTLRLKPTERALLERAAAESWGVNGRPTLAEFVRTAAIEAAREVLAGKTIELRGKTVELRGMTEPADVPEANDGDVILLEAPLPASRK